MQLAHWARKCTFQEPYVNTLNEMKCFQNVHQNMYLKYASDIFYCLIRYIQCIDKYGNFELLFWISIKFDFHRDLIICCKWCLNAINIFVDAFLSKCIFDPKIIFQCYFKIACYKVKYFCRISSSDF